MSNFGFLYALHNNNGKRILTQSVSGASMGVMLEHIAKTVAEQENVFGEGKVVLQMIQGRLAEGVLIDDPKRMESLTTLVLIATEHYKQKAGKLIVETNFAISPKTKVVGDLRKVLTNPTKAKKFVAELKLPDLNVDDTLLIGKWKNRKAVIKGFDKDEHNQPVAKTNKGDQKVFKGRVAKLMPEVAKVETTKKTPKK